MTFTIHGRLAGLNEIVREARYNRFAGATQKKRETRRCMEVIQVSSVPMYATPITVHFRWIEPDRRRDVDNIAAGAKFVLDALVAMRKIEDDSQRWVKGISHEFGEPDRRDARVEVTIDGA